MSGGDGGYRVLGVSSDRDQFEMSPGSGKGFSRPSIHRGVPSFIFSFNNECNRGNPGPFGYCGPTGARGTPGPPGPAGRSGPRGTFCLVVRVLYL